MSTSTRRYHHGNLREALVGETLAMLDEVPVDEVTLRALAQRAGVSAMAPYRHFADREGLMVAVAVAGFADLRSRLALADDPGRPRKALAGFAVAYVMFAMERSNLFRLMFGAAPPTARDVTEAGEDTVFGIFTARVAQLVPEPRRPDAFLAVWSMVHGFATLVIAGRVRQPIRDVAETVERMAGMLLDGITAAGRS